jgi:FKBP-type peptidyl-prolyl cis-trans isomerase FklB
MRRVSLLVLALSLLPGASLAEESPARGDEKQKLSYSVGYQVGGDFRRLGLLIDAELVVRGVVDALAGSEPLMTPDEMRQTLTELKRQAAAAEKGLLDAQDR